jgi:hypothetical protein
MCYYGLDYFIKPLLSVPFISFLLPFAGLPEECLKSLGPLLFRKQIKKVKEGLLMGIGVGLGFSIIENTGGTACPFWSHFFWPSSWIRLGGCHYTNWYKRYNILPLPCFYDRSNRLWNRIYDGQEEKKISLLFPIFGHNIACNV